jgi:mono/diheme cytochrome c family protein
MQKRVFACVLVALVLFGAHAVSPSTKTAWPQVKPSRLLRESRTSPLDLEVAGKLVGLGADRVRYLSREDLLQFPQVTYTVSDDSNFAGSSESKGVSLDVLARELSTEGDNTMIVAICDDLYRAHYLRSYIQTHHPVLVLEVNGQPPAGWPKSKDGSGSYMGPYLISHPQFTPSFKILGHQDEPQIPWGVIRLEFRNEAGLLSSIEPQGPTGSDPIVQSGYGIAQQNCWRCHGPEREGPQKGKLSWEGIALFAATSPRNFQNYVRNPKLISKSAEMPANPNYDQATLQALTAYFRTFFRQEKQ